MGDADFSSWTKPEEIANKILEWTEQQKKRPQNGHLFTIETKNHQNVWKDIGNPFL